MSIVYGITVSEQNDQYISTAEEALNSLAQAGVPGSFLVDLIPIRMLFLFVTLLLVSSMV